MHTYRERNTADEDVDKSSPTLELLLTVLSYILIAITFPLTVFCIFQVVAEYERVVIFRLGKIKKAGVQGPGMFFVVPFIDSVEVVDMRTMSMNIPEQEVITIDLCSIEVGAVVYYHIDDPLSAILQIFNYKRITNHLTASTLRTVLGQITLSEIMTHRDSIAERMKEFLDKITNSWGIKVERVEIKDIRLPPHMQKAMAAEAEAEREAKAKLIVAESEIIAAKSLREASQRFENDPTAIQIRYLESLKSAFTGENTYSVLFPLELLRFLQVKRN